jgi:Txe/YoeB family toxin of Txe-Axe toxin-antitoxin module
LLGKAPKMREPKTYEGCHGSYVPWMKAIKEYMTVRSMDFRDDTTKIYWLASLLKAEAQNWHQNCLGTAEKELQPDTWATYKAAMDYNFRDPYEKRTLTNKMVDLYWKRTPGHTKTGLSADQWGIQMAMSQEKAQCDGEVLKEIYMLAFTKELSNQAWREVQHLDDPKYEILKAKLVEYYRRRIQEYAPEAPTPDLPDQST